MDCFSQWKGEVSPGVPELKEDEKKHLGEELSDVLLYLVRYNQRCKTNTAHTKGLVDVLRVIIDSNTHTFLPITFAFYENTDFRLAERCEVDLASEVLQKITKNAQKYPVDRVKASSKKYTEYE